MSDDISLDGIANSLESLLRSHNELKEEIQKLAAKLERFGDKLSDLDKALALVKQIQEQMAPEVKTLREAVDVLRHRLLESTTETKTKGKTLSAVWVAVLGAVGAFGGLLVWVIQKLVGNGGAPGK